MIRVRGAFAADAVLTGLLLLGVGASMVGESESTRTTTVTYGPTRAERAFLAEVDAPGWVLRHDAAETLTAGRSVCDPSSAGEGSMDRYLSYERARIVESAQRYLCS